MEDLQAPSQDRWGQDLKNGFGYFNAISAVSRSSIALYPQEIVVGECERSTFNVQIAVVYGVIWVQH